MLKIKQCCVNETCLRRRCIAVCPLPSQPEWVPSCPPNPPAPKERNRKPIQKTDQQERHKALKRWQIRTWKQHKEKWTANDGNLWEGKKSYKNIVETKLQKKRKEYRNKGGKNIKELSKKSWKNYNQMSLSQKEYAMPLSNSGKNDNAQGMGSEHLNMGFTMCKTQSTF